MAKKSGKNWNKFVKEHMSKKEKINVKPEGKSESHAGMKSSKGEKLMKMKAAGFGKNKGKNLRKR